MNLITRDITANGRKFKFTTDEEHLSWYPDVCEIGALRFCEDNGLIDGRCFDLGCHHGLYALVMSSIGGPVSALDCDYVSSLLCLRNAQDNDVTMEVAPYRIGSGGSFNGDNPLTVSLGRLAGTTKTVFVKMDVEGEEEAVLSGSGDLFQGRANFYIELHPNVVSDYSFLWKYINRDAYQIWERGNEIFGKRL